MAAIIVAKPSGATEDDEEWLYGDTGSNEPAAPGTGPEGKLPPPKEDSEKTNGSQQQPSQDEDDDSDDEDDVHVTIGDIKAFPVTGTGSNLFKPGGTYQKQPVTAGSAAKGPVPTQTTKGVDVDGEGTVNGINLYEFTLDSLRDEDKPWSKPGADITDYFNYGFNEETWRKYCHKQNRLRAENGVVIPKPFGGIGYVKTESDSSTSVHTSHHISKPFTHTIQQPAAIAVLGSTAASRRPAEESMEDVQQISTLNSDMNKTPGVPPPGMPPVGMPPADFSVPPPGMPPMPPGFSPAVPPPGMNVPPPQMYSHPPPVPPFFPPHVPPPASFPERPPFSYETTPTSSSYTDSKSYDRDRDRDRDRDSYRDRDRDRYDYSKRSPGSGYSSDGSDDYRYRSREYSRDYDRDYYRSRDSDRSRDRERSRSRERDRRHRDRDRDDKKPKRKFKEEPDDSDYYKSSSSSSKHKKSKRSKRDKDDESTDKQTDDGAGAT